MQPVCGESTAFGLLITRDRGSSSEESRVGPPSGGLTRGSVEEVNPGGGETPPPVLGPAGEGCVREWEAGF